MSRSGTWCHSAPPTCRSPRRTPSSRSPPDGTLVVIDRGSTNGSILIREGVARELTAGRAATLLDGDVVRFGDREMIVAREA